MVEPVRVPTKTPPRRPWRNRWRGFNPKLHPLLAIGISLGFVALFLPNPSREIEAHHEDQILERLRSDALDPDHGPLFWLTQRQQETPLYAQALALCSEPVFRLRSNCLAILRLEELATSRVREEIPLERIAEPPPITEGER